MNEALSIEEMRARYEASEARRQRTDLADSIALIVRAPSYLYAGASDKPGEAEGITSGYRELITDLKTHIAHMMPSSFGIRTPDEVAHQPYALYPWVDVPGQGGLLPVHIDLVTIADTINPVIQTAAGWVEVGCFLLGVGRWWRDRLLAGGKCQQGDRLCYSMNAIRSMCAGHAAETYRIRVSEPPRCFVREGEQGSLDHPTGNEFYLVNVRAGRRLYIYLVAGNGVVMEHFVIQGGNVAALDLPDWFGDAGIHQRSRRARSVDA